MKSPESQRHILEDYILDVKQRLELSGVPAARIERLFQDWHAFAAHASKSGVSSAELAAALKGLG
jgi:hypothetical protein